jgi:hypothetical protein
MKKCELRDVAPLTLDPLPPWHLLAGNVVVVMMGCVGADTNSRYTAATDLSTGSRTV